MKHALLFYSVICRVYRSSIFFRRSASLFTPRRLPRTFTSLLGRFAGGSLPGRWLTLAGLLLSFAAQAQLNVLSRQPTRNAVAGGGTAALSFTPTTAFAPGEVLSVSVPPTLASTSGAGAAWQVYQFTAATGGTGRGFFLDMAVVGNTGTRDQLLGDLDLLTGGYIQFNGPAPAANPLTSTPRAAPAASVSFYPNPGPAAIHGSGAGWAAIGPYGPSTAALQCAGPAGPKPAVTPRCQGRGPRGGATATGRALHRAAAAGRTANQPEAGAPEAGTTVGAEEFLVKSRLAVAGYSVF